ncbi:hypothetical protein OCU04_001496 [Sclerotinia nivalis]|uniref:Uncharacterized protein n=1 Tax=Sclerotinia nivalis TaxID=352851 RepID=A0A9X0AYA6_9HELO|nr:hypothetical protein OCU04_001496 [Sclerotinia nivalis]
MFIVLSLQGHHSSPSNAPGRSMKESIALLVLRIPGDILKFFFRLYHMRNEIISLTSLFRGWNIGSSFSYCFSFVHTLHLLLKFKGHIMAGYYISLLVSCFAGGD